MTSEQVSEAVLVRCLDASEAAVVLMCAWYGGKNAALDRRDLGFTSNDDGSGYALAEIPLRWIRPNEEGVRYDGTCDFERVQRYALLDITTPVHLSFGKRSSLRGPFAAVNDGGHRVSAWRLTNRVFAPAVMRMSQYKCLVAHREALRPLGSTVERRNLDSTAGRENGLSRGRAALELLAQMGVPAFGSRP